MRLLTIIKLKEVRVLFLKKLYLELLAYAAENRVIAAMDNAYLAHGTLLLLLFIVPDFLTSVKVNEYFKKSIPQIGWIMGK